jgi:beta-galactosidase
VLGDFTWTAHDNLGEAGAGRFAWARDGHIPGISIAGWPWRTCYQGDLDLCGYRRPQSYFREAIWLGNTEPRIFTTHPEHVGEGFSGTGWHFYDVHDTWTFDDKYIGKPVKAEVYTDADEIEWILNGNSLGRTAPEKAIASIEIPYEKGELTAVAYKAGKECGRSSLHTVGKPTALRLSPEKKTLTADRRDLCYLQVEIVDKYGDRVTEAQHELTCLVDGGELMGIFSGDPCNEDQYTTPHCYAFEGRALVIIRAEKPGKVTVTVGSNGLRAAAATVVAK